MEIVEELKRLKAEFAAMDTHLKEMESLGDESMAQLDALDAGKETGELASLKAESDKITASIKAAIDS